MCKDKIIETIGKKMPKDFSLWYQTKVLELAGFFLKKTKEENIPVENNNSFESHRLEVILK